MWASSSYFESGYIAASRGHQGVVGTGYPRGGYIHSYLPVSTVGVYHGQYEVNWDAPTIRMQLYSDPALTQPVDESNWTYEEVNTASKPPERNPNGYRQRKLKARLNNLPKD